MSAIRAGIFGVGSALPGHHVTNDDWAAHLDTSDEWIVRRTGISNRYWLTNPFERDAARAAAYSLASNGNGNGHGPTDAEELPLPRITGSRLHPDAEAPKLAELAALACERALADAGRHASEVDRVLISTITADRIFPGLAPDVAQRIGAVNAGASDLSAACAGFVYGLEQAAALVESGRARCVLLCGAEALSRITDVEDRGTAVLFGDGAGAVVVAPGHLDRGCGAFVLGSDGTQSEILFADHEPGLLQMKGQEVYRHAVARMVESTRRALAQAGVAAAELDLFVGHQANSRIIAAVARELGVAEEKVVYDMGRVANTSSASIPIALAQAQAEGRLTPGALIGVTAVGGGLVWGAGVIQWKERTSVVL